MKKCPFCAEEIQDAAIVCKHCGRELKGANVGAVTVRKKANGGFRSFVLFLVGAGFLAFLALSTFGILSQFIPSLANRHINGDCHLTGEAIVTPRDQLSITNRDTASWDGAQIRIYGQITSGSHKGPTGVHTVQQDLAPGVTTITLTDFQNAEGERWVPVLMHAEGMGITATLRGEHCEVELSVHKP